MTVNMLQLWMPIVFGGLLVWVASGLVHMVIKYHNSDYLPLSNEDEVAAAIRNGSPSLGVHSIPYCVDMAKMNAPEMQKKFADGPVAFLTVFPTGAPPMGKLMAQQIAFCVLGCAMIAYCATLALPPGAQYLTVFRFASVVGFLTYGWATIPFSIWYGHRWSTTAKYLLDALIYGMVAGGMFAWLWPTPG